MSERKQEFVGSKISVPRASVRKGSGWRSTSQASGDVGKGPSAKRIHCWSQRPTLLCFPHTPHGFSCLILAEGGDIMCIPEVPKVFNQDEGPIVLGIVQAHRESQSLPQRAK